MIPPTAMAIAALTIMLWILWSDTVRPQRPRPVLYAVRVALYLIMAGVLVLTRIRNPRYFGPGASVIVAVAALVGIFGAVYFGRRMTRRV